ncbi:MAG: 50S ribosomal protein L25/general stress protein Ctc [Gammaproteobacteria bacterium]|nr:50S ribosomal protein L25/general stress protein Ctc [Gammaproteobacteria bacterium]
MAMEFMLNAERREDAGKGASRRLRAQGKLPAILYGGSGKPVALTLDHNELMQHLKHESFHSQILTVKVGNKKQQAILKDIQRHAFKNEVLHLDLQRIKAADKLRMTVPLHFLGAAESPGIKEGGVFSRNIVEVEIECLPKDLPEYLELDVSALNIGDSVHLSDIPLPEDVALVALAHDDAHEHDFLVAAVHQPRVTEEEEAEETEAAAEEGAEAEAASGEEQADEDESADEKKHDESGE